MVSACGIRGASELSLFTCETVSIAHSYRGIRDFPHSAKGTFRSWKGRYRTIDGVATRGSIRLRRATRCQEPRLCRTTTMENKLVLTAITVLAHEHRGIERVVR